jgi:hypothetical protein
MGDTTALRLCLERISPAIRDRLIRFELPKIHSGHDVPDALASIMAAVADGEISPGEGAVIATIADKFRSAYELVEVDRRLAEVEEKIRARR